MAYGVRDKGFVSSLLNMDLRGPSIGRDKTDHVEGFGRTPCDVRGEWLCYARAAKMRWEFVFNLSRKDTYVIGFEMAGWIYIRLAILEHAVKLTTSRHARNDGRPRSK